MEEYQFQLIMMFIYRILITLTLAAFSGLMFGPSGIICCFAREAVRGAIVSSAFHLASGGRF